MKFHILLTVVFCAFLSPDLRAQTLTVTDQDTHKPLYLVTVGSEESGKSVTTNESGQANISSLKGSTSITLRLVGYRPLTTTYSDLEQQDFRIMLEHKAVNLSQVVISATRWSQSSGNVPSRIETISSEQIELQNPQTAADLLGSSGSVFIQKSQQGGGSPMIRGFATNRLLYSIDGVRMNTAIFRGGNLQNVISLDPFAIEHTEVLFGPGSVIYGSDAIGGVMSFTTLTPKLSTTDKPLISGSAVARYASANNEKTGHFDVSVGWKKWALATSISSFDYDHLRQGSNGPADYLKGHYVKRTDSIDHVVTQDDPLLQIPSAYSQINLMQKVRFKPNESWDFQYGFHYSETSPYGRYDRHNRMRNGLPRYAEWRYGPQKWMMNNLSASHHSNNLLYSHMTVRLAHQYFEESRIDRSFNKDERENKKEQVQAYSANLDLAKEIGSRNTLYYGVEYIQNDVTSSAMAHNITDGSEHKIASRYPDATWQSIGVYVNDEYRLSDNVSLQGGLRYNHFIVDAVFDTAHFNLPFQEANLNNGALTGSLGAVYRPADTWAIKVNFGTAFRAPNVDDIGKVFDSEPGAVVVPNPDLAAEYAYNIDLGIAKVFGDVVKLDVTGYYTILENALVRRDYTLLGQDSIIYDGMMSRVQAIQNAARATVYGVQAGLEIKLLSGFEFNSNFNFQLGEEELDNGDVSASRHAAPMFGVSRLSYRKRKLHLQLYANYQAERKHSDLPFGEKKKSEIYALDSNGDTYSPAWYTLNLKAMYKISDYFSISAGLENITDQRYRPYSSGLSGAGRSFTAAVKATF